jgi:hypothetical protein
VRGEWIPSIIRYDGVQCEQSTTLYGEMWFRMAQTQLGHWTVPLLPIKLSQMDRGAVPDATPPP